MALSFKLTGQRAMARKIQRLADENPHRVGAALLQEAERIAARSKNEFVPVDLGALRSSIHVEGPDID